MEYALLFDFGSTFTKAAVIDKENAQVVFTTKHPSTVKTDASIALRQCMEEIESEIGSDAVKNAQICASSSAAGGLRMAVIGLTDHLSISAGKNVAFGAGAKIISVSSGKLTPEKMDEIATLPLEMILFCGGYENGNQTILLHNAQMLAKSNVTCPIIYGGNSQIARQIRIILSEGHKECFLIPNIIPQVGQLQTEEAEEIIRNLFMKRIVNMKGLGKVQNVVGTNIMPTPKAVLEAGTLLSSGYEGHKGYGDLMIVDIGGATTDIHSYAEQVAGKGARLVGAKEPYAKRTVEGDLGMRESSDALIKDTDTHQLADSIGITEEHLISSIHNRVVHTEFVAEDETERKIDEAIAAFAAGTAARRHAGRIEYVRSSTCNKIQVGKNLMNVTTILGTGGPIINSPHPEKILQTIFPKDKRDNDILLPENGNIYIDSDYILYAVGLLSQFDKKLAFAVLENSLHLKKK